MLTRAIDLLKLQTQCAKFIGKNATMSTTGLIPPKPERSSFGLVKAFIAVTLGISFGATISRITANFLEENELFVPSDEDDDD